MELTAKVSQKFNDQNQEVFEVVNIPGHPLYLNGSYTYSPWAGDIDLYSGPFAPADIAKVARVVRSLIKHTSVVKVKVWGEEVSFKPFKTPKIPDKAPVKPWIKVNLLLFTGENIEEISVIYDFGEKLSTPEIRKLLIEDVEKYRREPDYYKMLKRKRLLLTPGSVKRKYIDKILDAPETGQLYLARVRASNLDTARGLRPRTPGSKGSQTLSTFTKKELAVALGNLRQLIQVKLNLNIPVTMGRLKQLSETLKSTLNHSLAIR